MGDILEKGLHCFWSLPQEVGGKVLRGESPSMERLTGLPEIKLSATTQATCVLVPQDPLVPLQVVEVPALAAGWREAIEDLLSSSLPAPVHGVSRAPLGESDDGTFRYEALTAGEPEEGAAEGEGVNERAAALLLGEFRGNVLVTKIKVNAENDFLGYLNLGLEELQGLDFFRLRRKALAAAGAGSRYVREAEGGGESAPDWRLRACFWCRKAGSEGAPVLRCSRCQRVVYCSQECQRSDWKYHRHYCGSTS